VPLRHYVGRMPRRNLIPLLLLAVLVVLTAVFAVVGAASAPTATTIQVQNAADKTFGTPTGATSWLVALTTSVSVGSGAGAATSQERVVGYNPPDRMLVYSVSGSTARLAGVVPQAEIACVLSSYAALVQGPGSWQQSGEFFTRTETLADYSARVPVPRTGAPCVPQPTSAAGQVYETAVVRSNYLIATRARIVTAAHGTQGEQLVFLRIGDVAVTSLGK
jgi:hypothetical protein